MIRALLVTHGRFGQALTEIVEGMLGPQSGLRTLSNRELSAVAMREKIDAELAQLAPEDELFLFSDLAGGSCEAACRAGAGAHARCWGVSGLNLPMLLEFCHYRDRLPAPDLLERVLVKGRSGVRVCGD